jgi:hypothetical protein
MSDTPSMPVHILHPDPYLAPVIHMSPFSGKLDMEIYPCEMSEHEIINFTSDALFGEQLNGLVTVNGREAIARTLEAIVTSPDFRISILTPSGSGYVSGCVTTEISKRCEYVYGEAADVDAYFMIHEFGRPMQPSAQVVNSGKPIIEDCAYACVTPDFRGGYGVVGDYIIYSLPKAFEMQYGGMLFIKDKSSTEVRRSSEPHPYLLSRLRLFIERLQQLNQQRLDVYHRMQSVAGNYGFEEVLAYDGKGLPHAFMVRMYEDVDADRVKTYINRQGIESSFFYGGGAYFLPCHQNLTRAEIEYMFYHLRYILDQDKELS